MHISKFFGETYNEFKNLSKDIHLVKSISNKLMEVSSVDQDNLEQWKRLLLN